MTKFEGLALRPPVEAMETRQVDRLPLDDGWLYEPKWDGFRCIAFRCADEVELESKAGESLTRYFPEIVAAIARCTAQRFVLDGELFVEGQGGFDFDALLQRIHPAASRVETLSKSTPARYAVFDLLVDERNARIYERALAKRRPALERFAARFLSEPESLLTVSPVTQDASLAQAWFDTEVARLDGAIAKRLDAPYDFGGRNAVVKVKRRYTADCVVGGFRVAKDERISSLLLGLYDEAGKLDHVGFVGSMTAPERRRAEQLLRPIVAPPGFTGSAPGGPSRWRKGVQAPWFPVKPEIVVEVSFDHVTARRFRHACRLLRWRPDKSAHQCGMEQLLRPSSRSPRV